jgi:hypothetical protein
MPGVRTEKDKYSVAGEESDGSVHQDFEVSWV